MLFQLFAILMAAAYSVGPRANWPTQATDSLELRRLEVVWNRAHVSSDTVELSRLWDDDLIVAVPEMPVMTKAELLRFWRSGRSTIARYETSDVRVRVYGEAAVVTGLLNRDRNFNGRLVSDHWRFTKAYVRRSARWQVVAYHASVAAGT